MISLVVAGLFLVMVGSSGGAAMACDGGCGGANCAVGGFGLFGHYQPAVTWYAPYPWWWPQYFGPPYSDYQVIQYVTPPAVSAEIVRERIAAINAANPALLTVPPKEPLPFPKPDGHLPPAEKLDKLPPEKK